MLAESNFPAVAQLAEKLTLQVRTSRALAEQGLEDRIAELNRREWVPVIGRALDAFGRPDVVRLERLVVKLGRLRPGELNDVPQRLAAGLRDALAARLAQPRGVVRRPAGAAMLAMFEHYLVHGAWPYGSGIDVRTTPGAMLRVLVEAEPQALVAMLRARGGSEPLLRRLVLQIPERLLGALLHRLEPVHAAYVLAYLEEVRASHAEEPVVPAGADQLAEMLWTIVLRDALGQSGLQANRKAFLRRLLRGLAEASGTPLSALLRHLRRGLLALGKQRRAPGSLVEVLGQLMAEESAMLVDAVAWDRLSEYLFNDHGRWSAGEIAELRRVARAARKVRPTAFASLVRRSVLTGSASAFMRLEALMPSQPVAAANHYQLPSSGAGVGFSDAAKLPSAEWSRILTAFFQAAKCSVAERDAVLAAMAFMDEAEPIDTVLRNALIRLRHGMAFRGLRCGDHCGGRQIWQTRSFI